MSAMVVAASVAAVNDGAPSSAPCWAPSSAEAPAAMNVEAPEEAKDDVVMLTDPTYWPSVYKTDLSAASYHKTWPPRVGLGH